MAEDGALGADPERLADRVVPVGGALEDEDERVAPGSTTQPSHVPNDGPSGIDWEPGACGDGVGGGRAEVEEQRAARERGSASPRGTAAAAPGPARRGATGPAWFVGRIRAK